MHTRLTLAALALVLGTGCAAEAAPKAGAKRSSPPSASASPADRYPGVPDYTCTQIINNDTGDASLGVTTNEWAGQLLAALVTEDGISTTLSGITQANFAIDIRMACLANQDSMASSARDIGVTVYNAHKEKYVSS